MNKTVRIKSGTYTNVTEIQKTPKVVESSQEKQVRELKEKLLQCKLENRKLSRAIAEKNATIRYWESRFVATERKINKSLS